MQKQLVIFVLVSALVLPLMVLGGIGVGVGTGKIVVKDILKPGVIYNLPIFTVLNTGDEPSDYAVEITTDLNQPQLKPLNEWFSFSPARFHLEPKKSQPVVITLTLPMKIEPGDYFGYVDAHPVVEAGPGTSVGISAASKLYFSVAPANLWQAIIFRISSFWARYTPWNWVILATVLGAIIIVSFKRRFAFQIGIRKK